MTVQPLQLNAVDDYLRILIAVDADSGLDGNGHSHAYSKSETIDLESARERELVRWRTGIDQVGWRRAWGLFDQASLVGHVHLAGAAMTTGLHRVTLGMGIDRSHRRLGGGTRLLETVVAWARLQPSIDWIDLGVFSDNSAAEALYLRHGFEVRGRTRDQFRVDGESLDEVSMTLNVSNDGEGRNEGEGASEPTGSRDS